MNAQQQAIDELVDERTRLRKEIERLQSIVDNLPHGVPIGVNDRHGNPIHIGDTLKFCGEEWDGPMKFVVSLAWGQIDHPGATSDLSNWCEIIESWNEGTK